MSSSTRWLVGVLVVVALVAVAGVVAAMNARPGTYPEGSPERVVQEYVQAIADRDSTKALSYMSKDLLDRCDPIPTESIARRSSAGVRATLQDVMTRDTRATVRVEITESYGDAPFGGGESKQEVVFELQQTADGWRFREAPWPLYCPPKPVR